MKFTFFRKATEQLSLLFDTPTQVAPTVRKDGTVVKPYIRLIKKKAPEHKAVEAPAVKPSPASDAVPTQKEMTANIRKLLDEENIKARVDMIDGTTRVFPPAPGVEFNEAEQRKIRQIAKDSNFTLVRGVEIDVDCMTDPLGLHLEYHPKKPQKTRAQVNDEIQAENRPWSDAAEFDRQTREELADRSGERLTPKQAVAGLHEWVKQGNNPTGFKAVAAELLKLWEGNDRRFYVKASELLRKELEQGEPEPDLLSSAGDATTPVPNFGVPAGTSKAERKAINQRCIELLDKKQSGFSPEELSLLRQYSGNGGVGDSLNEFYTDPQVASAMWEVLRSLGLDRGDVLEPSCATGVFMATAPGGFKVTGVEMDPVSSKIASILFSAQHGVVNASLERFANDSGGRQFDAVIGNAPFGLRGSLIKDDKPDLKTAESYFMDTSLDMTRPGGLVAMVVPTGLLDSSRDRAVRQRLLCKGEFLGAMRMPNTAFEHSHTEVTSDILFFRKRPDDVAAALLELPQSKLKELVWDAEYMAGEYYSGRGAGNVLGTLEAGWRAKAGMGNDITVTGSMEGVPAAISAFQPHQTTVGNPTVQAAMEAAGDDETLRKRILGATLKRPYERSKAGDTKVVDGVTYVLEGNPLRWHRIDEYLDTPEVIAAQPLADEIAALMSPTGSRLEKDVRRQKLEAAVQEFVKQFGIPVKNANLQIAARTNKVLHRLIGAVGPDGRLSDILTGSAPVRQENSLSSAAESMAATQGTFSVEEIAERWGHPVDATLDQLYANDEFALTPEGIWTTKDKFFAGELWPKLDALNERLKDAKLDSADRSKLEREAKLMDELIAPRILDDVECMLNSAWIPLSTVEAFFNHRLDEYKKENNYQWAQDLKPMSLKFEKGIYEGNGGMWSDAPLLLKYLNRTGVRKDDMPKVDEWNKEFKEWLCGSQYRDEMENLYNRKFRGFRQEAFSNDPFDIPGLNAEGLKQYQYGGVRWALAAGKGIIAADVGLGKTVRALMLARMAKLNGQAKQPWIVVPKSVLANWDAEISKWFPGEDQPTNMKELGERMAPGLRLLVIGETYSVGKDGKLQSKADSPAERNRKFHDSMQNDYDIVLVSQPAFNDLDLDPIKKGEYVEQDFWVQRGDALGNAGDKRTNKIRTAYEQAMADREFRKRSDAVYFNDLKCDMLIADEGHAFKNLYAARNRFGQTPKFLGGQGLSNRALDMTLKCRWIREHNGGKNVYMLTATPTKNSPLEIYSMLSHIAPEAFERIGIRNSEEFLDRFCKFEEGNVLSTTGGIEKALITVGFKNLNELREIMRRYIDRTTAEQVGLELPKAEQQTHMIDMTPAQEAEYVRLRELASKDKEKDDTGESHIFSIMDKMGKAAMDLELLDESYAGERSPKYDECANTIAANVKDGGQIVFAESIKVHPKIVAALKKRGIKESEMAIFNAQEADDSAKRQNITDAFNAGKIKVVIGNATMSEGVNLQKNTADIHDLDIPWEPASMQQRHGRGVRQGNVNKSVRLHAYLAKGSFDGYRYQSMMAKKDWQDLLWNGGDEVENLAREGAVSREEMLIMLSANPEEARHKYEGDKAAALARLEAGERTSATGQFVRFQDLKRSYGSLKNKNSPSAGRLKVKLDRMKNDLSANKYFSPKWALDAKDTVLLHPSSGIAMAKRIGLEMDGGDDDKSGFKGRWIVTAVNPNGGDIEMRQYGQIGPESKRRIRVNDINVGVKTFDYKEADEAAEVEKSMAAMSAEKIEAVKQPKELRGMSDAVISKLYPELQERFKAGLKDYAWSSHGEIPFVDKEGKPVIAESYDARKMVDTHDLMLPTSEHRQLAIQGYIANQRAKEYRIEYVSTGQRRSSNNSKPKLSERYPGKYGQSSNTWRHAGNEVFGDNFDTEAKAAFEHEQADRIRKAPTFKEAIAEALPMLSLNYSEIATWPKKAISNLYVKAKHDGVLGEPMAPMIDKREHRQLFDYLSHGVSKKNALTAWAKEGEKMRSVRDVLIDIADHTHHTDLSAAMIVSSAPSGHAAARELVKLEGVSHPDGAMAILEALEHIVQKDSKVGDAPFSEFTDSWYGWDSRIGLPTGSSEIGKMPLREVVEDWRSKSGEA